MKRRMVCRPSAAHAATVALLSALAFLSIFLFFVSVAGRVSVAVLDQSLFISIVIAGLIIVVIAIRAVRAFLRGGSNRRRASSGSRGFLGMLTACAAKDGPAWSVGWTSDFRWRLMQTAAQLMPPAAGKLWLESAESVLFEAEADSRSKYLSSYVSGAPQVIALSWAGTIKRGPASR